MSLLENLSFDNAFTRNLPPDPESRNYSRQVRGSCYSRVLPVKFPRARTVAVSREMLDLIGLPEEVADAPGFAEVFSGSRVLPGMDPFAMCYGGHQFGHWAGQLGDGRAINLGEVLTPHAGRWTLQLKGAGPTPYSRSADGFAVLRSSVREFLCSEAMHHLGVPTTRALSLVLTGEKVMRDMFYDGRPEWEPGAVVCRVAPTFLRFGNFQILAARGEHQLLEQLVDHCIQHDFSHLGAPSPGTRAVWFSEICERTARMILDWMRVGYVHGVMNTDNMSVLGQTIDYGPYGWIDDFDPDWTPNTTDAGGRRYRFGHQPEIALWNLGQFASALTPVFPDTADLEAGLGVYTRTFEEGWQRMMGNKLGLAAIDPDLDPALMVDLLELLHEVQTDMTLFFRGLAEVDLETLPTDPVSEPEALMPAYYRPETHTDAYRNALLAWLTRYRDRVRGEGRDPETRRRGMNAVNPLYVLRNYIAQVAIDEAQSGNHTTIHEILEVLRNPYEEQPGAERWAGRRPDWARNRPGCSMLSCSS